MSNIPNYIEELISEVPHNGSIRFCCPACHGYYSLGITKDNGKVKWHCFRVGCKLKSGNKSYVRSISELRTSLQPRTEVKEFLIPKYLSWGISSKKTLSLLINSYCMDVYSSGLFDVAYDPEQDRVCFIVKQGNEIVGLIGKACSSKIKPKVLNYPNSNLSIPFICNNTKTLVLVEDCLSAASVARIPELSGMALLGTSFKNEYLHILNNYDTIIVALDRDARKKALSIKNKLKYYHKNVKIWLLSKDIKNMNDEELLREYAL